MIDRFMEAVTELDGIGLIARHRIHRTAKLVRRRIEGGEDPSDAEWSELFPLDAVCQLARTHLAEPADVLNLDFEATWVGVNARAAKELQEIGRAAAASVRQE